MNVSYFTRSRAGATLEEAMAAPAQTIQGLHRRLNHRGRERRDRRERAAGGDMLTVD